MATVRLIVVVLVLGLVVLLGVQNLAPALPLVFLGGNTQALPLGVWLVGAVLLGALTTLGLTALMGPLGGGGGRSQAYKYRPQSFYEPTGAPGSGAGSTAGQGGPPYTNPASRAAGSGRAPSSPSSPGGAADDDPSWRAWTNLTSPAQWNDWESLSRATNSENAPTAPAASSLVDGVTTWFSSSKQRAKQQQRVNESLRELDDWDDLGNRPYTVPGASPVQDSLDDISQGWGPDQAPGSSRDFESAQAPRRVYRDGSLYSYSYREDDDSPAPRGQVDNIYAPPDDAIYRSDPDPRYAGADYPMGAGSATPETAYGSPEDSDFDDDDTPLSAPAIAEDGVVDADYRVIVPPYSAAETAATTETWVDRSESAPDRPPGDDWDDADDALTP